MASYKACKCSLLAGLCWWRLEEADSINGPRPRSWLSGGRVIWIWTATWGKVHYAPHLFPFSGVLPWKHQLKLKIWLSICGVCNEHQMEHCTLGCHVWKQQQSTADVRWLTHSWHWLNVNCCLCLDALCTFSSNNGCNHMCLVYLYITISVWKKCLWQNGYLWYIYEVHWWLFSTKSFVNYHLTSGASHQPLPK